MKYIFSFVFGAACGVGATLIFLHKEIKKELDKIRENSEKKNENAPESPVNGPNSNDTPFVVSEGGKEENAVTVDSEPQKDHTPIALSEKTRTRYDALIRDNYGGEVQNPSKSIENIQKREEEHAGMEAVKEVAQEIFDDPDGRHWAPIDDGEYDNNPGFDKDRLVFYEADRVLSTESGKVIENGYVLIGNEWEDEIGHYASRTAYIRNNKTAVDYEIYVEAGSYADEWGTEGAPLVED